LCEKKKDNPTAEIISQILPTAARYLRLDAFVKQITCFEFGVVNHALSAAIRELLKVSLPPPPFAGAVCSHTEPLPLLFEKEYLRLVAQLEHQLRLYPDTFTLQQLVFHISPTMHTLARLDDLISVILSANEHGSAGRGGPRFLKNASIGGRTLDILANQVTQRGGYAV
jgi:gamma-tubulin complex component 2